MTTPFLIVYLVIVVVVFGMAMLASLSAAPWLPTRRQDVERLLNTVRLQPGELLIDLGCGDARLLISAAKKYNVKGVGYELSLFHYLWSLLRVRLSGTNKQVVIKYQNFFNADFGSADAIVCFLTPKAMKKLQPKVAAEMRSGCRFASYSFSFPDLKATQISRPASTNIPIYMYEKN